MRKVADIWGWRQRDRLLFSDGGFNVDVELDIIGVAVEVEIVKTDDITKEEHVEDEQERTKY